MSDIISVDEAKSRLLSKSLDELIAIVNEKDTSKWTKAEIQAARQIFIDRTSQAGIKVPGEFKGVKGWLLFWVFYFLLIFPIICFILPIYFILTKYNVSIFAYIFERAPLSSQILMIAIIFGTILSIIIAYFISKKKKIAIILVYLFSAIGFFLMLFLFPSTTDNYSTDDNLLYSFLLWMPVISAFYFKRSKRVKNTLTENFRKIDKVSINVKSEDVQIDNVIEKPIMKTEKVLSEEIIKSDNGKKYQGIRGWLIFWVVFFLIIYPFVWFIYPVTKLGITLEVLLSHYLGLTLIFLSVLSLFISVLILLRKKLSVTLTILFFIGNLIFYLITSSNIKQPSSSSNAAALWFLIFISGLVYFIKSKRVKNTLVSNIKLRKSIENVSLLTMYLLASCFSIIFLSVSDWDDRNFSRKWIALTILLINSIILKIMMISIKNNKRLLYVILGAVLLNMPIEYDFLPAFFIKLIDIYTLGILYLVFVLILCEIFNRYAGEKIFDKKDIFSLKLYLQKYLKKCPYCAEYIKKEAIICKHCGSKIKKDRMKNVEQSEKLFLQKSKTNRILYNGLRILFVLLLVIIIYYSIANLFPKSEEKTKTKSLISPRTGYEILY